MMRSIFWASPGSRNDERNLLQNHHTHTCADRRNQQQAHACADPHNNSEGVVLGVCMGRQALGRERRVHAPCVSSKTSALGRRSVYVAPKHLVWMSTMVWVGAT
jgi:hypothetical protein